jgi:hypothetical protein
MSVDDIMTAIYIPSGERRFAMDFEQVVESMVRLMGRYPSL